MVIMEIEDEEKGELRKEVVKINYDFLPKYYTECKMKGHSPKECRILHPELNKKETIKVDNDNANNKFIQREGK